ncbi:trans-2,3-dihydro-3-hydroxyanthranilate isomerase [Halovenus aranensis]|uniref:Trans-2,3-dihydro-3-hydroxyanthranilate isomerase n=1 Tax=Halovenus aranensis TaxID=890420 RepID=A0A1G8XTM6_9EURY|nr:PhzF family phenazine biosynthesis protein [Halovenus aranensis]SDJ93982.1 trans-2,3-dihydro-3-hydroxyanthranilate isomerase [Halovenus aranensis]
MTHPFHIVDVFAREKYAGNQLAVVTDAGDLSGEEMQAIAAEMDYSETTFVTGEPTERGWPVRIFTPEEEVPFAGHPTLGTASVIRQKLADDTPESVTLDLKVGSVPVTVGRDGDESFLWMSQQPPEFGDELDHGELAAVLGLEATQVDDAWPVRVVSTGLPTIVVPLEDRAALEDIDLDRQAYDELVADRDAKLVHAVCPEPRDDDNDLAVRMFSPYYGVPEDPATGSANGCLAAYLSDVEYFGSPSVDARVEQGYEMGRPSLLLLHSEPDGEEIAVRVGGRVVPVARGDLL